MTRNRILILTYFFLAALYSVAADFDFTISNGISNSKLKEKMEKNVISMLSIFNSKEVSMKYMKKGITEDAKICITELLQNTTIKCSSDISSSCLKTISGYQVRGIPVDLGSADSENVGQNLTIDFTPDGNISNVSISIGEDRYNQIMAEMSSQEDYVRRQQIVSFVEQFRTAYNRKDMPFLQDVYSDKALIITGSVRNYMVRQSFGDEVSFINKEIVVYLRQTKHQYLKNLQRVFNRNEFINISFEDIDIVQHPKYDDIYGVTLKQKWYSSHYSDEGYLFLMIDFRNSERPLIQVRTWQPYKNSRGEVILKKEDVFNLGSFRIVR